MSSTPQPSAIPKPAAIPMFRPRFTADDTAALSAVLDSGMVATGARTHRFESEISALIGAEAAVATGSGTSAMTLALSLLGVGPGDEVITPSLTCIGVVNAIARSGAIPVFADVEPEALTIDTASVRAVITARTRAIVPVHYGGHAYDIAGIADALSGTDIAVISDLAHALGATADGRPLAEQADLALLSFHATKIVTTGEGGMLAGRTPLIERARSDTRHGLTDIHAGPEEFLGERWTTPGLKVGMSDLAASLGLSQLSRLDASLAARRRVAETYTSRLAEHPGLRPPTEAPGVRSSWHFYTLRLDPNYFGDDAGEFISGVNERGGAAGRQFYPAHLMPLFAEHRVPLPVTEREAFLSMSLPVFPGITETQVSRVCDAVLATAERLARA